MIVCDMSFREAQYSLRGWRVVLNSAVNGCSAIVDPREKGFYRYQHTLNSRVDFSDQSYYNPHNIRGYSGVTSCVMLLVKQLAAFERKVTDSRRALDNIG
jgi:hypothetical protein